MADEPALIADYVVIRHRLEVGERVSLPVDFHILRVELDDALGDLTIWTLEPIASQHRPDESQERPYDPWNEGIG